jgi:hypothetical protein
MAALAGSVTLRELIGDRAGDKLTPVTLLGLDVIYPDTRSDVLAGLVLTVRDVLRELRERMAAGAHRRRLLQPSSTCFFRHHVEPRPRQRAGRARGRAARRALDVLGKAGTEEEVFAGLPLWLHHDSLDGVATSAWARLRVTCHVMRRTLARWRSR